MSTKVGGVQEVLPNSMINFAEPTISDLVSALVEAISQSKRVVPSDMHTRVVEMYNWMAVCKRTELVYDSMCENVLPSNGIRFMRYLTTGPWSGAFECFLVAVLLCLKYFWDIVCPMDEVEICPSVEMMCVTNSDGSLAESKKKVSKEQKGNNRT